MKIALTNEQLLAFLETIEVLKKHQSCQRDEIRTQLMLDLLNHLILAHR
jgi:hypothetical protein